MSEIREMTKADTGKVLEMMRVFYASPAVLSNGSEDIFRNDIQGCLGDNPYLEGYVFTEEDKISGYSMIAKSFSTEYGKPCIWIEDLYIEQEYRHKGIGTKFFAFIEKKYPDSVLKLEVEKENQNAVSVYKNCGYEVLPYMEMKKDS
ncbi:MAG: GNAT family N-acetyltransferase [Roseburia sp.]|nr:GNAT family N-acetyltransferase [Roseburia sp.]